MFCNNCGCKLPKGSRFCPNCGQPVKVPFEDEKETEHSEEVRQSEGQNVGEQEGKNSHSSVSSGQKSQNIDDKLDQAAEDIGSGLTDAVQDIQSGLDNAGDSIRNAGDEFKRAGKQAGENLQNAGEKVRDFKENWRDYLTPDNIEVFAAVCMILPLFMAIVSLVLGIPCHLPLIFGKIANVIRTIVRVIFFICSILGFVAAAYTVLMRKEKQTTWGLIRSPFVGC